MPCDDTKDNSVTSLIAKTTQWVTDNQDNEMMQKQQSANATVPFKEWR